jgi:uracil-DNA glycosylase family 4
MPLPGRRKALPTASTTPWQEFKARWRNGCGSACCEKARRICLARGDVPCDIMFVGQAPGESENRIGFPFVGPAGSLLDSQGGRPYGIVQQAGLEAYRCVYTNLVCCRPRDGEGNKTDEPDVDQVESCSERLIEFVRICDPKLIVCVGKVAKDWLDPKYSRSIRFHKPIHAIDIYHPSAILQARTAQKSLMVQRCVVALENAVYELQQKGLLK